MSMMPYRDQPLSPEVLPDEGAFQISSELVRTEIDCQIATAKKYKRSLTQSVRDVQELATLDEHTAASCIYTLPRGGKNITGPSIRFAEIIANAWGNLRVMPRISEEGRGFIVAQCVALDLEKNLGIQVEVRRKITDRNGRRFNDDMIIVTQNAALSIAFRNAIFKVVPFALVRAAFEKTQQVAIGKGKTVEQMRAGMLEFWGKKGIHPADIFRTLGIKGVEDITIDHLIEMRGHATALAEGDSTLAEIFPPEVQHETPKASLSESLKLRRPSQAKATAEPVIEAPPEASEPPFDMKG